MSFEETRKDFPILTQQIYGKPLVYFDNAATTQKPVCVIEKIKNAYYEQNANIHRGVHFLSERATEAHECARKKVQQFINARSSNEIIFTRGTTEAINLVAFSFGETFCKEGDEIIVTEMEHHSNTVPWQMMCERKKVHLKVAHFDENGMLNLDELRKLTNENTKLIAVAHVSNVLGTVNPVKEIAQIAHAAGALLLVDGAQSVPHLQVDVQDIDADFFAFSGHKIYGPTGIGVLFGKEQLLEKMQPYQGGGEMIQKVTFEKTTYNELPFKFEAGTPDFIGSTALAEALNYVEKLGMKNIAQYEHDLLEYARKRLSEIDGMRFFGNATDRSGVLSFLVGNIHPYDMGSILDKLGIAVRTGHHCAQPVMDHFGIEGTVRASFAFYNTKAEIDTLFNGIVRAQKMFR
ncbi:MAG: cysteine desulfurase [Paludibacteraceae bacterium]|nr:cysteine desulfurase [Paludibacteraceae bacterium]